MSTSCWSCVGAGERWEVEGSVEGGVDGGVEGGGWCRWWGGGCRWWCAGWRWGDKVYSYGVVEGLVLHVGVVSLHSTIQVAHGAPQA